MIAICHPVSCTGCSACVNTCPVNVITMSFDLEDFLRPEINSELCIDCNRCINICL